MELEVFRGDITQMKVEAIVSPEDSNLSMGGGLARKILRVGGIEIFKEAQKHVPLRVGEAVLTKTGKLPCRYIIHAPTMERPQKVSVKNTKLAMKAVLECAEKNGLTEVAVPGLGTGTGKVPFGEAAKTMIGVARSFKSKSLKKIIFVAYEDDFYLELKKNLLKEE